MVAADDPRRLPPPNRSVRDTTIDRFLLAIMAQESGGKNVQTRLSGSASGFWQIINSTWASYGGYRRAMDAPFAVQLEKARAMAAAYYDRYGGDPRLMSAAWYGGTGTADKLASGRMAWSTVPGAASGNTASLDAYADRTVNTLSSIAVGTPVTPDQAVRVAGGGGGDGVDWAALDALTQAGLSSDDIRALARSVDAGNTGGAGAPTAAPSGSVTRTVPGAIAGMFAAAPSSVADTLPPNASEAQIEDFVNRNYGFLGWALRDPELRGVLIQAAQGGWDSARLQGAIYATNWWKTHNPAARDFEVLRNQDPAAAEQQLSQLATSIRIWATRMGITMDQSRARQIGEHALTVGMTEDEVRQNLVGEVRYDPNAATAGDIGAAVAKVKSTAASYLVPLSNETAFEWAKKMVAGEASLDGLGTYLAGLAKSRFPQLSAQIDQGFTPGQILDPYRELIASELEISPTQVDFVGDPRFAKVIATPDEKNGQRLMTMGEAQTYARSLPEWRTTRKANSTTAAVTQFLGQRLGVLAS